MSRGQGGRPDSDALRQWQALQLSKLELELQQQALTALQQSSEQAQAGQALYQQLFELSPACSYALDRAGRVVCANQAGAALLAQSPLALQGQPFERYLAPEEQPRWRALAAALLSGGGAAGMDSQLFAAIPGACAVRLDARLDAATGLCCVVMAPQARDEAVPVAQLRLLAEHEANALETARMELARTMHDQVGQNLLALRMEVALLNQRTQPRQGPLHMRARAALDNVDVTLRSVRAMLNQLRPAVLDLGLQAAMDWLLADFRKRSGLACTLDVPDEQVFDCLDDGAALVLFRQLQAALQSIQGDAGASSVAVSLRRQGGSGGVLLMVTDDGAGDGGAAAGSGRRQRQALVMLAIGERLRSYGGKLEVVYGVGQGCRISMRLPGRRS
ncbi:histidine kinase [Pseudoduganella sp. UC29_71]|uniref:sensor histidine kinase n=1 Tax=Pseudoduganella sp. UC29_71 TaxID=3350174 RepID=UPI00366B6B61